MVYLPLSLFQHILSFKDPRYERVRNGDPFGATPTRVWYTYDEHNKTEDPYKNTRMRDLPIDYDWGSPYIQRIGPEKQQHRNSLHKVVITVFGRYFMAHGAHSEKVFHGGMLPDSDSDDETDDVIKCSNKVAKMSMQCEACGPDLELYHHRR